MTQQDYIRLNHAMHAQRKRKNNLQKKRNKLRTTSLMIIIIVMIAIVAFIGCGNFIANYNKKDTRIIKHNKMIVNSSLPSKPKERWNYIKELEDNKFNLH